jgi:bifunctional DNase/RNase
MGNEALENQEVLLEIRQLGTPVSAPGTQNIVVLGDAYNREIHISIGLCEAMAILRKLEAKESQPNEKPYAHDLLLSICQAFGAKIEKVVIDDLWKKTYYAKLHFRLSGEAIFIDARPSDAIALALRAKSPIYATEAVMEAASFPSDEPAV